MKDPGEKPLEGVGFFATRASSEVTTGPDGARLITGSRSLPVDFAVSGATLEDPMAVSEKPGVRFVPRPGHVTPVDFPVLVSGEITGTVRVAREGESREVSGVVVQLVAESGQVVAETRSAYDGFYDMTKIVPGRYTVRASPTQLERLKLKGPAPRPVVVEASGTILDGVDLRLEPLP